MTIVQEATVEAPKTAQNKYAIWQILIEKIYALGRWIVACASIIAAIVEIAQQLL